MKLLPGIEELWNLVDQIWIELGCDSDINDKRISDFYSHPIWLLNGLFTEIDTESQKNRQIFMKSIKDLNVGRMADYGGGYGSLCPLIAENIPNLSIDLIEPHASQALNDLSSRYKNLKICPELNGFYDLLVAIDVFEHLFDPIQDMFHTSKYLKMGGFYLVANNFYPVALCHLPQNFHRRFSLDYVMIKLGFKPKRTIKYGKIYQKVGEANLRSARKIEEKSIRHFSTIQKAPRVSKLVSKVLFW